MKKPGRKPTVKDFARAVAGRRVLTPRHRDYVEKPGRVVDAGTGLTLLMKAARENDLRLAERIVLSGAPVDVADRRGQSALHHAVAAGHLEMARLLLSLGASPNIVSAQGQSILTLALEKTETAGLAFDLLAAGADVDHANAEQRTPLILAARLADDLDNGEALIDRLVDAAAKPEQKDERGWNALHHAVEQGQRRVVARLLDHRLDGLSATRDGDTILHMALDAGAEDMALDILARGLGALVPAINSKNETPLHLAVRRGLSLAARRLIDQGASLEVQNAYGFSPLHVAAQTGRIDLVREMVGRGVEIDLRGHKDGITPLMMALQNNEYDIAEFLLHAGADPNAGRTDSLQTPLMLAARSGQAELLALALDYGGDVMRQDEDGNTVLHYLGKEILPETLRRILAAGPVLDMANKGGQTPLLAAAAMGKNEIVSALVKSGARTEAIDSNGMTALMLSILYDKRETVSALILAGADINARNPMSGMTALHYAAAANNEQEIRRLVLHGAKVDVADKSGRTPLHLLCACYVQVNVAGIFLVGRGADILARDVHGATPYDYIYTRGNTALLHFFRRQLEREGRFRSPRHVDNMPTYFPHRFSW